MIERIAVAGAGQMGSGVAHVASLCRSGRQRASPFQSFYCPKKLHRDPRREGRMSDLSVLVLGADPIANRGNSEPILEQPAEM